MAAVPRTHALSILGLPRLDWRAACAPFGLHAALALLAGVMACLWRPGLPAAWVSWCLLAAGAFGWWRGGAWRLPGALAFGFALAGLQAGAALDAQLPRALEHRLFTVEGRIVELPLHDARRTRLVFRIDASPAMPAGLRGREVRIGWFDDDRQAREALRAGSRWRLPVYLHAPRGLRNPGGRDGEKYAMAARIAAVGHVAEPALAHRLAAPSGLHAWREAMSARIAASVPAASSRFVRALALGDTRGLGDDDWARLRAAGLTHLIAISGFHVGLVAGFFALSVALLWWLFPALGRWLPRPLAAGVGAVCGAFAYAAITGFALPTLRTALMIAAVAAARLLRRRHGMFDVLGLACIVLVLLDPLAVLGAGFWLSFAGVAWLLWRLPGDVAQRGPGGMLRGFVAAQAVATLGLLPLTVLLFGQASLAGPFANLVAVPWWSLIVIPLALLGLLAETLAPGCGAPLWKAARLAFDATWPGFAAIADSPLALAWLPEAAWYALPLALFGAWWLLHPAARWRPLALLLWWPLLFPSRDLPGQGEAELAVIDVGQGLSVLVRTARHALLYDMGPAQAEGFDAGEAAVVPALHALGVPRLDAAVLSHGDNDHAGGWASVRAAFPPLALLAPAGSPAPGIEPCVAGQSWEWDGVRFRMLHPTEGFPYFGNEASCVLRIETAHGSALLSGDIGDIVERGLLRREAGRLRNDVVIVPHHGSAGSSSVAFVQATGARLAVVSSGAGNRFGHPRADVVARWCEAGAEVVDTAYSGALRVWLRADGLLLDERRASKPRIWDAARRRDGATGLCYRP